MENNRYNRFWEMDFLRGFAVCMMITYHIFFDLNYFDIYTINLHRLFIRSFLYSIGTTFLLVVGISLSLSFSRSPLRYNKKKFIWKYTFRGTKIFLIGLCITTVTWIYPHEGFILFGVLHCIGLSIILSIPFLYHKLLNVILGILIIALGINFQFISTTGYHFVWLGIKPTQFYTLDYFPLFPWFGVVLLGIAIGNHLYPKHIRAFSLKDRSLSPIVKFFTLLGRNSLIIYILHQPFIIFFLFFVIS